MPHNNWVPVKLSINILQWQYFVAPWKMEKWAHDGIHRHQVSTFVYVVVIINQKLKNKEWNILNIGMEFNNFEGPFNLKNETTTSMVMAIHYQINLLFFCFL